MVTEKIFETALRISSPWFIAGLQFSLSQRKLNIRVDCEDGSCFAVAGQVGVYLVQDTVTKTYRHLSFLQHECELEVWILRLKLPDGKNIQIIPPWSGMLSGFTLLFETFVLLPVPEMTFSGAASISELLLHRVMSLCGRYMNDAVSTTEVSEVRRVTHDETSRAKGHEYMTLFVDAHAVRWRAIFLAEGKDAAPVGRSRRVCVPITANHLSSRRSVSTCHRLSSAESGNICPVPRSPLTDSTSSPIPWWSSTRCVASNKSSARTLRVGAGRC